MKTFITRTAALTGVCVILLFAATPATGLQRTQDDTAARIRELSQSPTLPQPEGTLLKLLTRALDRYEHLKDYECLFDKQEARPDKTTGPAERLFLKFEKPFKIYLGWLNTDKAGLQVVYERGRHDNQLAVHQPGLLFGLAQVVFLSQDSPWVKEGSASFNIEDAGIGTFLYEFCEAVLEASTQKRLQVHPARLGRMGEAFEVTFDVAELSDVFFARRIVVFFDRTSGLPTRMRLYDWEAKLIGQ
ncbi:MAG: DUF1571 domain-containing protein, partial [Candidatus Omnitrophota bacterium]